MSVFDILTMIGGLALFLYGMEVMGNGLSKASGGRMERILEKMTDNIFKAVLLGAGVTAVIQSSSATTVLVVGFVNSSLLFLQPLLAMTALLLYIMDQHRSMITIRHGMIVHYTERQHP